MLETAGGLHHFRHGQIVGNAGHLRARFHHLAGLAAVQVDDLQNDLLFARRQRALLIGHFEQFLVFGVREARRRRRRVGPRRAGRGWSGPGRRGARAGWPFAGRAWAGRRARPKAPGRGRRAFWERPRRQTESSSSNAAMTSGSGWPRCTAIQRATATIPALAKLLPSTRVASKSCGSERRRLIILPRCGERASNWRSCHLPSEKREVSASAKKKLAPAKPARTTNAMVGVI